MILVVFNGKGGSGKSTLAVNIAAYLAHKGKSTILADLDRLQASSNLWNQVRKEAEPSAGLPEITCVQLVGKNINADLIELEKKFGNVIVDTPGSDNPSVRSALIAADIVLTPIVPSLFDVAGATATAEVIEGALAINPDLKPFAVIFRSSPHPKNNDAAETIDVLNNVGADGEQLDEDNPFAGISLLKTQIRERSIWRKSVGEGRSILEVPPHKAKAAAVEFTNLLKEINILKEANK